MSKPQVSILTTCFNCEKYIADCIESVLGSSFQDWEMIIVDDQSQDRSVAIAKKYAAKDDRIRLYINEKNLGDYPNRNKAASYAIGTYLKYLDADDMLYKHTLEIMVNSMVRFPDAAMGISEKNLNDSLPYPLLYNPRQIYETHFLKKGLLGVGPSSTIIKRAIFENIGGFSGTRFIGDTELWLRICASYALVKTQSGLVFKREHDEQEYNLGHQNFDYFILDYKIATAALESEICPLPESKRLEAMRFAIYRLRRNILHVIIKKRKPKRGYEMMIQTQTSLFQLCSAILKKHKISY